MARYEGMLTDPALWEAERTAILETLWEIVVTPTDDGEPMRLRLVGNVAKILEEQPRNGGAILAVAGPRNQQSRTTW
jgi:hypothetical protein